MDLFRIEPVACPESDTMVIGREKTALLGSQRCHHSWPAPLKIQGEKSATPHTRIAPCKQLVARIKPVRHF